MIVPLGPRSLELFFDDGRPDGMLTAEVVNWTGHVLFAPRTRLKAALERAETCFTEVYLLLDKKDGEPTLFIGEAEDRAKRIRRHDLNRASWTEVVVLTTPANVLNKAHVRSLKARLIEEAKRAARARFENSTQPTHPGLSGAARANIEAFLASLFMVLPAIRIDVFESERRSEKAPPDRPPREAIVAEPLVFVLESKKHGLFTTAQLIDGAFVVQKGARARLNWEGRETQPNSFAALHARLMSEGLRVEQGEACVFTDSDAFDSASAAAAVVLGLSAKGQLEWREAKCGKTEKE